MKCISSIKDGFVEHFLCPYYLMKVEVCFVFLEYFLFPLGFQCEVPLRVMIEVKFILHRWLRFIDSLNHLLLLMVLISEDCLHAVILVMMCGSHVRSRLVIGVNEIVFIEYTDTRILLKRFPQIIVHLKGLIHINSIDKGNFGVQKILLSIV
jgi:hypothetical protein